MRRILRGFLVLCTLTMVGSACSEQRGPGGDKEKAGPTAPVPVEYTELRAGPIENTLRFSANLEAEEEVQVLARTSGQIVKLLVEEGDLVKRNDLLLRIEDEEQRSAQARAFAELTQAKRDLAQQVRLQSHGVASSNDLEKAELAAKRLQLAFNDAKRILQYTSVRSSIAGTVTMRQVKRGDFVNPNQHLFTVTNFDSIVAKVFVPEKEMYTVQEGVPVRLYLPSEPYEARDAVVERVSPIVDPRSGTAKVTVGIPSTAGLKPGAFVSVELVTASHEQAVLLPRKALVYDNDQPFAFKIVGDKVVRIAVNPILSGRYFVEPESGFAVGDKVVVAGQVGLKDEATVTATLSASKSQNAPL